MPSLHVIEPFLDLVVFLFLRMKSQIVNYAIKRTIILLFFCRGRDRIDKRSSFCSTCALFFGLRIMLLLPVQRNMTPLLAQQCSNLPFAPFQARTNVFGQSRCQGQSYRVKVLRSTRERLVNALGSNFNSILTRQRRGQLFRGY